MGNRMNYDMEDPYPGRCTAFKQHRHSDSFIEALRCVERESERHICRWPEPTHVVTTVASNVFSTQKDRPKPWIPPPFDKDEGKDEDILHVEE